MSSPNYEFTFFKIVYWLFKIVVSEGENSYTCVSRKKNTNWIHIFLRIVIVFTHEMNRLYIRNKNTLHTNKNVTTHECLHTISLLLHTIFFGKKKIKIVCKTQKKSNKCVRRKNFVCKGGQKIRKKSVYIRFFRMYIRFLYNAMIFFGKIVNTFVFFIRSKK